MLKKILLGLGVVLSVFLLGLVAVSVFFDANRYKPEIERYVREHYKRTVRFDGDLALSVFPRIALALPQTTLSNLAGDRVSASLQSAEVSVALLPLLLGRFEVGTISIDGLSATVERRRDGTTSIDDLIRHERGAIRPVKPAATTREFEVGAIELTNADLVFNDLEARRTLHLSKLAVKTGRLAPLARTPLQFDAQFDVSAPPAHGQFRMAAMLDLDLGTQAYAATALDASLKATVDGQPIEVALLADRAAYATPTGGIEAIRVDARANGRLGALTLDESRVLARALAFDPQNEQLAIGGVEASAKGKANAGGLEATLAAPKLEVTETTASGQRVALTVKFTPAAVDLPGGEARLTLEGVSGSAQKLEIAKVALDANGGQGTRSFAARLSGALAASIEDRTLSVPHLAGAVTLEDPALPERTVKVPLTAQIRLDAKAEAASAGIAAKFDGTDAAVEFSVRGFSAPRITFEASADRLNLDRYVPQPKPVPGNDSADQKDDPKVDFSALHGLDLSGTIRVGNLQVRGVKASKVDVELKAAEGRLEVAPLNAQLYGGTLAGAANLRAEGNHVELDTTFNNVSIQPLLRDLLDRDLLEGHGNVKLAVSTSGATIGAMKRRLGGSAVLELRDGAIKGIDLAAALRNAGKVLLARTKDAPPPAGSAQRTVFSELNATFAVNDGVALNEDLELKSPLLRASGTGQVDVGGGSMDFVARVSAVGTLKGQDGRPLDQLRGLTVPVTVSGPLDRLAWMIDWNAAAQEPLQAQAAPRQAPKAPGPGRGAMP
ncbi:MAG TPA: AsmA family protein [Burkholderiaceae bacterium]|nr:AsmA family protein [Burkholderiaceae bacterium]